MAEILANDMFDRDGGYFFNYLCLSGMFYEVSEGLENEISLRKYMDQKVDNIIDCDDSAMSSVKYRENQSMYQNIDKHVLSNKFYEYQDLFYQVLEKRFVPEKSIFTGYETLPVWKAQRENFMEVYKEMCLVNGCTACIVATAFCVRTTAETGKEKSRPSPGGKPDTCMWCAL